MTTQLEFSVPVETWVDESIARLGRLWKSGFEFEAAWLHTVLRDPPHHNAFGGLVNALKRRGLIEFLGYQKSTRPERNGSVIGKWRVR